MYVNKKYHAITAMFWTGFSFFSIIIILSQFLAMLDPSLMSCQLLIFLLLYLYLLL